MNDLRFDTEDGRAKDEGLGQVDVVVRLRGDDYWLSEEEVIVNGVNGELIA